MRLRRTHLRLHADDDDDDDVESSSAVLLWFHRRASLLRFDVVDTYRCIQM